MCVSELTSGVAAAIDQRQWPCLQKTLVMGDEFLGRTKLSSFNVFVRNARVSDKSVADEGRLFDGAAAPPAAAALLLFACDTIGRFKADAVSAAALLAAIEQRERPLAERQLLRFSDVGALLTAGSVVQILLQIVGGGRRVDAKL